VYALGTVVALMLAAVLPSATRSRHRSGDRVSPLGLVALGVGGSLLVMRDVVPDFLSIVLGNTLISWALAIAHLALGRMLGRPQRRWLVLAPVLVVFHWVWTFMDATVAVRALGVAPILGAQSAAVAVPVLRAPGERTSAAMRILALGFILVPLTQWPRAAIAALWPDLMQDLFWVPASHTIFSFSMLLAVVLIAIGAVLLHRDTHEAALEQLAMHDPLTNLLNRRAFGVAAAREEIMRRRCGLPLSLLLLDLDHFKRVNDSVGHAAGDALLVDLCGVMLATLRRSDIAGRVGGDEFSVLLPATTHAGALRAAERLREAVREARYDLPERLLPVTLSIGVATLEPEATEAWSSLVARADRALYAAKEAGRDRVVDSEPPKAPPAPAEINTPHPAPAG